MSMHIVTSRTRTEGDIVQLDLKPLAMAARLDGQLTRDNSKVQTRLAQTLTFITSLEVLETGTSSSTPSHQHFRYSSACFSTECKKTYGWLSPEKQELLSGAHLSIVNDGDGRVGFRSWISGMDDTSFQQDQSHGRDNVSARLACSVAPYIFPVETTARQLAALMWLKD
jgi:hypothetical protein